MGIPASPTQCSTDAEAEVMTASVASNERVTAGRDDCAQLQSPLLSRPGEIRNCIYAYMIDNIDDAVFLCKAHRRRLTLASAASWAEMDRNGLALTQVCRLTREEFQPLYQPEMWARLYDVDVFDYVSTMFPGLAKAAGKVAVFYPTDFNARSLDITPLVRLALKAKAVQFSVDFSYPQVLCYFHSQIRQYEKLLEEFLHLHDNREGLARAAKLFKEIKVHCDSNFLVSFTVYAADAKPWMPYRCFVGQDQEHEAVELVNSVGFYPSAEHGPMFDVSAEGEEECDAMALRRQVATLRV